MTLRRLLDPTPYPTLVLPPLLPQGLSAIALVVLDAARVAVLGRIRSHWVG